MAPRLPVPPGDEQRLTRLRLHDVQRLQGGERGQWHAGGLFHGEVAGDERKRSLIYCGILRECPNLRERHASVHAVAGLELDGGGTHLYYGARELVSHNERRAVGDDETNVPTDYHVVQRVYGSGVDTHEHLVRRRLGGGDVPHCQGRAVLVVLVQNCGLHWSLPSCCG
jgi:hypothetical protein